MPITANPPHHDNQYTESFKPMILRPCLSLRSFSVTILYSKKMNCSGRRGRGGKGGGGGVEERERWVHAVAAETCRLRKKGLADLDSYTTVKEEGGTVVL